MLFGTILTLEGRAIVLYMGYNQHVALIQKGAEIGAARLWYDRPWKQFYLSVTLEIETADPTLKTHMGVIGVDIGVHYLAVTPTRVSRLRGYAELRWSLDTSPSL